MSKTLNLLAVYGCMVLLMGTAQAVTVFEDFEGETVPSTDAPPSRWTFQNVEAQAGTFYEAVENGDNTVGRVKADTVVNGFYAAGYIVSEFSAPATSAFSGSFDLLIEDEGGWSDGFGYSADEFYPAGYGGNGTGSGVGHDIWSLASPYYNGSIMENTITRSGRSLPLYFSNTDGMTRSEIQRTFARAQDWTVHGIKFMSLNIYGQPDNTGQLYVKINDARVTVQRVNVGAAQWQTWTIDLSTVNTDLTNVTTLTIGIEDSGATGLLFVDDIKLSPTASPGIDIGSEGTMLNNGGTLASQWIRSDSPEDVKGNAVFVGGLPSGADLRGVFAFNLTVFKPGDVISNVTMSLFHGANGTSNHTDGSVQSSSLELLTVTNSAYANNRASWNNADQDTPVAWNTPGGDVGQSLATVSDLDLTTIDSDDEVIFNSTELTAAVQAAVDAGDSQITFVLRSPDLEAASTRNFFVFQSATSGSIGPNLHVDLE